LTSDMDDIKNSFTECVEQIRAHPTIERSLLLLIAGILLAILDAIKERWGKP
jgi:hypothetical protein